MSEFETIDWQFDAATGIGTVVLDRPDSLNAISGRTLDELIEAFDRFDAEDRRGNGTALRTVLLRAAGERAFSVGADIEEFDGVNYPHVDDRWHEAMAAVADCPVPTIAEVDGYCVGGGFELALACDFRVASRRSEFGFPEIDIGLMPNGGGTVRLADLVGTSRAKELCMTGEFVDAEAAVEEGIVSRVHDASTLEDRAQSFAKDLAGKAPLAVRVVKDVADHAAEVGLADALEYERTASLPLYYTDDYREGVDAFREDREPEWRGS